MSIQKYVPITLSGETYFVEVFIHGDENISTSVIEVEYDGNIKSTQKGYLSVEKVVTMLLRDLIKQKRNMMHI